MEIFKSLQQTITNFCRKCSFPQIRKPMLKPKKMNTQP